ncbi:MAG: pyridoxal phosphate-dependent aminotransferase, partial [Deltaproteobacteria bacterium]|nr:pyridoxal phosphate-dependent aminotransferase [Deltaproteobacteria bacterium]
RQAFNILIKMNTKLDFPAHLKDLKPFLAMEVLEESQRLQAQGKDVISFSIGEPDFPTPKPILEALIQAIQEGETHYTHCQGLLELREAIAEHYLERYQVTVHPDQIFVTSGSSPALLLALSVVLSPGDEVLLPEPYYPCYPNFLKYLQASISYQSSSAKQDFYLNVDHLKESIQSQSKALLLGSPANPTGQILSSQDLKKLAHLPLRLIVDEVYHGLSEKPEHSILEFTDQAFVINGFSKAYAMTGFRLGYLIAPFHFIELLRKLSQNLFISTTTFVQKAGIAALQKTQKEQEFMRQELKIRRELLLKGLKELNFPILGEPQGAFYLLAQSSKFHPNSLEFCSQLLQQAKVALTPGLDFSRQGEGLVRFSYTTSQEGIQEGLKRIAQFLAQA